MSFSSPHRQQAATSGAAAFFDQSTWQCYHCYIVTTSCYPSRLRSRKTFLNGSSCHSMQATPLCHYKTNIRFPAGTVQSSLFWDDGRSRCSQRSPETEGVFRKGSDHQTGHGPGHGDSCPWWKWWCWACHCAPTPTSTCLHLWGLGPSWGSASVQPILSCHEVRSFCFNEGSVLCRFSICDSF